MLKPQRPLLLARGDLFEESTVETILGVQWRLFRVVTQANKHQIKHARFCFIVYLAFGPRMNECHSP